jgi:hypothetical protein
MAKKLVRLTESDLHYIIKESVNKVLFEVKKPSDRTVGKLHESGYDSYPQSGYEDFKRIGENTAYDVYRKLRDNVLNGRYYLDGECINKIIRGFEFTLWMLVENGEFDEYEAKFRHPLGVSRDEYIQDVEDGKYN